MKKTFLKLGLIVSLFLTNSTIAQNNALNFDGINDYVNLNSLQADRFANRTEFSIEFWMRADRNAQTGIRPSIFAINQPTGENRLLIIMGGNNIHDGHLMVYDDGAGGTNTVYTSTDNIGDNECHHIAYTFSNSTGRVYIDGILRSTHSANYGITLNDRYSLGQEWDNLDTSQFYNGLIDDFRIWNSARTAAQINANMNLQLTGAEPGLIAFYNFNQGIAGGNNTGITTLTDNSGNGNTGNLLNFTRNGATSNFVQNSCSTCTDIDSLYTVQTTNITSNTTWIGKLFIPDNTIITVDNAILDITNVDLVFGQCAGIDFTNGATLRANNSVFRPCNVNDTWRGLRFEGQSTFANNVNENTFKNAEIALLFEQNANAEINSNTFSNCNEGVTMNGSLFTEPIFGNNFITNNAFPQFTRCYASTDPTDVIHIHSVGISNTTVSSNMSIYNNNFVMTNTLGTISSTGIDMLNSQAIISENSMTNMEFGIVASAPRAAILIEGNEIENNYQFRSVSGSITQIGIFNANGAFVSINNNELRNSRNDGSFSSTGIYLQRSRNIMVQNNELQGFANGISTFRSSSVNFTENQLSSISNSAIYLSESGQPSTNFITCNDITMVMGSGTGITTLGSSSRTQITSNCVKDGKTAITVNGTGAIPFIRNNYLYNYSTGINNIGHSGNIGTTSNPGMNTLWSNLSSGIDVASTTPITIANNFGQANCTWATVSIQGNNALHSTASCGHQISTSNAVSQGNLNTKYTCDNLNAFILPKTKMGGVIVIPSNNSVLDYLNTDQNKVNTITQMIVLDGFDEEYLNNLLSNVEMTTVEQNLVKYSFYKFNNRVNEANEILAGLDALEYNDYVNIESILLKKGMGDNLTTSDMNQLNSVLSDENVENNFYNLATSLTKTGQSHGVYRISIPTETNEDYNSSNYSRIQEELTTLEVYPNPSSNEIFVQILEGKKVEGQTLKMYDLYGNLVHNASLDFVSGRTKVNISNLVSGAYFIVLESDGQRSERTKFIKL